MRTWLPRAPTVLVVDDDPDILRVLAMVFEAEGFVVRQAAGPGAAQDQLAGTDVVVVDQRMPDMTGTELVAAAKAAGASCRFLVISADGGAEAEARRSGADGFLPKPLDVRDLLSQVERLFSAGTVGKA